LLQAIRPEVLRHHACFFAGGTVIALRYGEYRESVDVDFACATLEGYRGIREHVASGTFQWMLSSPLNMIREIRIDQYGVRTAFEIDGEKIKFEIIHESYIAHDVPQPSDRVCGVWSLTRGDLVATKLMANADRWPDSALAYRDLIDLAMLAENDRLDPSGVAKATAAYGATIRGGFDRAKAFLLNNPEKLTRAMVDLSMTMPLDVLVARLSRLHIDPEPAPVPTPARTRARKT
jgi:hypothetical protein